MTLCKMLRMVLKITDVVTLVSVAAASTATTCLENHVKTWILF